MDPISPFLYKGGAFFDRASQLSAVFLNGK